MRIVFSPAARDDLVEIRQYLGQRAPDGFRSVTNAIRQRIRLIEDNPHLGRPTSVDGVREAVEPRYGFLIPYRSLGDTLVILRLYRGNRRPLDYEDLEPS